jgi:hypothetical protein
MSDSSAIADVGETLLKVLREQLAPLVAADHITLASPADVELDTAPWLVLFLYQIVANPHLQNPPLIRTEPGRLQFAPLTVDLLYLVVPYAQSRENEHQIMGRVMQIFAAQPVLRGSWLQGSLAGSDEELRVLHHALPLDELLRLWTAFNNKPYKLSVSYLVTPVRIDSARPPISIQPVTQRDVRMQELRR